MWNKAKGTVQRFGVREREVEEAFLLRLWLEGWIQPIRLLSRRQYEGLSDTMNRQVEFNDY